MSGLLKFITCGSVDDGKSTLIGHILYDSKLLYADQEKALELDSKVGSRGGAIDYSLLLDGLMAERDGQIIMVDDDRLKLRPGEKIEYKNVRFRTLGCYPLTGGIESNATTLDEIIDETLSAVESERTTRVIDNEAAGSMERRKREGYF